MEKVEINVDDNWEGLVNKYSVYDSLELVSKKLRKEMSKFVTGRRGDTCNNNLGGEAGTKTRNPRIGVATGMPTTGWQTLCYSGPQFLELGTLTARKTGRCVQDRRGQRGGGLYMLQSYNPTIRQSYNPFFSREKV